MINRINNTLVILEETWPEAYLALLEKISFEGELVGKTQELHPLFFQVDKPQRCLVPLNKNWKWALHEGINRLSFEDLELQNPGTAYNYRASWKRKLNKEGGKFCYTYGYSYTQQIPFILKRLRLGYRECIINIWNQDYLFNRDLFNRRPCTLTLQFLISNDKEVDLIVNMRTSDIMNLLPYDFFHHTLLQRYIASKLNLKIGKYCHLSGHAYYHKKRNETGSVRKAIEKLKVNNTKSSLLQTSQDWKFGDNERKFLMTLTKHLSLGVQKDGDKTFFKMSDYLNLSEFGQNYVHALLSLHKLQNIYFNHQINLKEFEAIKLSRKDG